MIGLGEAAKALREEAGLTVRQLADRLGIDFPNLSAFEHGRRLLGETVRRKYREAIGVDLHSYWAAFFLPRHAKEFGAAQAQLQVLAATVRRKIEPDVIALANRRRERTGEEQAKKGAKHGRGRTRALAKR